MRQPYVRDVAPEHLGGGGREVVVGDARISRELVDLPDVTVFGQHGGRGLCIVLAAGGCDAAVADGGSDAIVNPTEPAGKAANAMVAGAMSAAMKLAGKAAPLLDNVPDSVKERVKDAQTSLRQSK